MQTEKFRVTGMTCAACSAHVEKAVAAVPGVEEVTVSLLTNSMHVAFDRPATAQEICSAVASAGYGAELEGSARGRAKAVWPRGRRWRIMKRRSS